MGAGRKGESPYCSGWAPCFLSSPRRCLSTAPSMMKDRPSVLVPPSSSMARGPGRDATNASAPVGASHTTLARSLRGKTSSEFFLRFPFSPFPSFTGHAFFIAHCCLFIGKCVLCRESELLGGTVQEKFTVA